MFPNKNQLFVIQDPVIEKTSSGIILSGMNQEDQRPNMGTVEAVGCDENMNPLFISNNTPLTKGMRVMFPKGAGTLETIDGKELLIINVGDIRAWGNPVPVSEKIAQ